MSNAGELEQKPVRIASSEPERLLELLESFRPVQAVVETSPVWPWLYDLLSEHGHGFVLAHAKKLRAIAEANYKSDEIDAELLARMRVAGLIPEVYPKPADQRSRRSWCDTAPGWSGCGRLRRAGTTPSSTYSEGP